MPDDKYILLQKWVRGETTAREEAQLAAWAREDSFLADALEGYAGLPEADHAQRLERLKKRLADPRESRKPILIWWPRLAAAAAVLLLAVAGFWWVNSDRGPAEVAQEMQAPALEPEPEIKPETPAQQELPQALPPENEPKAASSALSPEPDAPAEKPAAKKRMSKAEDRQVARTEAPTPTAEKEAVAGLGEQEAEEVSPMADAAPAPLPDSYLSGRVVNARGEPLVGAAVYLAKPRRLATTDRNGYFNLTIPDTAQVALVVSYTGFQSRQVTVPRDTHFLQIQLDPGVLPLKPQPSARSRRAGAEPMGGFLRWEQYLEANKRYPEPARQNGIRGVVGLSFGVDEEGRPEDIRIEQSLGYGCDAEAIRLLQIGPDWVPSNTQRTKLSISFP